MILLLRGRHRIKPCVTSGGNSIKTIITKDCYRDEIKKNGDMIGNFPVFKVGKNIIGSSENVGKVEVKVNEMWI